MLTSPVHDDTTISSASATVSSTTLEVGEGEGEVRVSVDMEVETNMFNVHTSFSSSTKPHATCRDPCWNVMQSEVSSLSLDDFCFIRKLGSGDIGSVYLVELKGNNKGCLFAAKVMDKEELVSRSKEGRAGTEREILEMLDHPFLPTLYTTLDTDKWSLLLTEFCPGGDLHVLRQRLPEKRFDEAAVRFYTSEVVVALEYLHMMGIIYRDLKPENVLVRSDGHIMLTDFDLSLKCDDLVMPQLVHDEGTSPNYIHYNNSNDHNSPSYNSSSPCILPNCIVPQYVSCWYSKHMRRRRRRRGRGGTSTERPLRLIAEPIEARSMSFVGTHEYLAPEIVSGEGHGNAVDWWTLGIFMYELLYGVTPFRGLDNEFTLSNIVARAFEFPKEPLVPNMAKDLITQLLVKDPTMRMGSMMGATTIKQHPFFDGVNWALLRCTTPPHIPTNFNSTRDFVSAYDDDYVDYY
ncbi:serine/threonine-protein kinase D6PKL2-like [Solanum tuberosum]|uniref:non-specific serine/threonine protein kinase n=1 Tax=Solanum tuberosum TaxID=4113 RepID=M1BPX1_SOLTU|nr:PREDICTED: serine/threonine-protein kinase D6PKL2-like [Solanum tuberosum]